MLIIFDPGLFLRTTVPSDGGLSPQKKDLVGLVNLKNCPVLLISDNLIVL
jgi:hypothetical protein